MHTFVSERKVAFVAAALLILALVACGIGLRLTAVQRRAVQAALLSLEREAAEAAGAGLRARLLSAEGEILGRILERVGDFDALARLASEHPLVHAPFLIYSDGAIVLPPRGKLLERSRRAAYEVEPADFENARRLLWQAGATVEDAIQAFREIRESESMAPRWRLRALAAMAALEARQGDPQAASAHYREIFEDFAEVLSVSSEPSYLQVSAAALSCRFAAERYEEAARGLAEVLERIEKRALSSPIAEERFFLRLALKELDASVPRWQSDWAQFRDRVSALLRRVEDEAESFALAVSLRDWLAARSRLEGGPTSPGEPQHFFPDDSPEAPGTERGALVVWSRAGTQLGVSAPAIVGFRANARELESLLETWLPRRDSRRGLLVRVGAREPDGELVSLAALPGELSFVRLGLDRKSWEQLSSDAERPFRLAALLIALLCGLLVLGIFFLWRGARREMALARMKTEFVANVSHELKTPLALIRLFAETLLMERTTNPAQRSKYYQIIARESERLAHLISNVLSFAGIEAGKKTYRLSPCDLGETVRDTYERYCFHLEEKGFEHHLEIQPDLPSVLADPDAVAQALINLLENAVKYSPNEKAVWVSVRSSDQAVRISVRDRGVGIHPKDQPRVWEDYYRTPEARALSTRGSGLGLSVVRHIVNAHGGKVELESEPGRGSVFTLVFPAYAQADSKRRQAIDAEVNDGSEGENPDRGR